MPRILVAVSFSKTWKKVWSLRLLLKTVHHEVSIKFETHLPGECRRKSKEKINIQAISRIQNTDCNDSMWAKPAANLYALYTGSYLGLRNKQLRTTQNSFLVKWTATSRLLLQKKYLPKFLIISNDETVIFITRAYKDRRICSFYKTRTHRYTWVHFSVDVLHKPRFFYAKGKNTRTCSGKLICGLFARLSKKETLTPLA